jgi:hypothetical protein
LDNARVTAEEQPRATVTPMLGLILSLIVVVLIPIGVGVGIIEWQRGHPWLMRGCFGTAWRERHDGYFPDELFDAWLSERREARISAAKWLDQYPVTTTPPSR